MLILVRFSNQHHVRVSQQRTALSMSRQTSNFVTEVYRKFIPTGARDVTVTCTAIGFSTTSVGVFKTAMAKQQRRMLLGLPS